MHSSLPAIESAAEEEDLTTGRDQMEMVRTSTNLDGIILTQVIPISSEMSIPESSP